MFTYVIMCAILLVLAFLEDDHNIDKSYRRAIFWSIAIVMTLFQGLRWETGGDWAQYLWTFNNSRWDKIFTFERGYQGRYMEWGYMLLNVTIKTIFKHYTFFLLITCGFINYTFLHFVDKYVKNHKGWALALAICFSSMFPVRQYLAASIFYWAIPYILNRDWKRFAIIVFLCYTIHSSSLALVIVFWFHKQIRSWILIGVYWSVSLWVSFLPNLINGILSLNILKGTSFLNLMSWYSSSIVEGASQNVETNQPIRAIILASILIILFCWMRSYADNKRKDIINVLLNLYVLGAVGKSLAGIEGLNELARLSYYSALSVGILLSYCITIFAIYKNDLLYLLRIFIVLLFVYHFVSFVNNSYAEFSVPYYSVFEDAPIRSRWM